ncbi:MAG: CHAD domain-containing protein [Elusimicrobiota bacterium]
MTGAQLVVLGWIDGADKAACRARRDPLDAHALHRFRINARRLVVCGKVIEKSCGVPAKLRKRLRRALRLTGACRDAHVRALWLNNYSRRSRNGAMALAKALSREVAPAPGRRWWRKIDGTLQTMRRAVEASSLSKAELREAQRQAADKKWRRFTRRLRRLDTVCDQAALHAVRISVKRLRYLLETMEEVPRGLPTPATLRGLQAALGDAHDRDVIAAAIAALGPSAELRSPARQALRQLKREKNDRLSCAKSLWRPLLGAQEKKPRRLQGLTASSSPRPPSGRSARPCASRASSPCPS